ncbi:Rne/Rng family ribonuclease [Porphyrobacter sp. AAP82]|uniref:Rne/Rng family ribonuclease n=1 Tax=Porphyrobacter sp. AAP82 TaxID=1248917 RepID=UPI0003788F1F|nr:ribonuclease E/G [Porphyrobacter sp. AAP82]
MATRMLIDARHPEETRVAVLQGNRIEEFDFESAEHKQIKGNIYLAKVTRVEPSLQAAFVDFGGNRHGFLAFSEIHPDYYQIPKADRDALLAEEAEAAEEEERLRAEEEDEGIAPGAEYDAEDDSGEALAEDFAENGVEEVDTSDKDDVATIEGGASDEDDGADEDGAEESAEDSEGAEERRGRGRGRRRQGGRGDRGGDKGGDGKGGRSRAKQVDEVRAKRMALRRRYKIQDVIQRRQVLLVQVVKEERGNKGAALTTYLSLAGRYTVLMPNSSHGGGISRKISSTSDRKRLKDMVSDLKLPKTMGLIVRTAGMSRTKPEIKRDFDYLARVWDEIRENTLASVAPALIHSDSDLIKRAIRDIYNKDIEEVVVEGEEGYKSAKAFMKLLMPSHARRVKAYSDPVPLFQRYGAEDQLRAMYDPMVQLKSGGYLIINPTEALVSIDINSGRSTKEHGIEATALHTNLEAAREIARQLRLRDMAGLVVIDFIDMEYPSNVRKVEKAMKDALKNDRARIQVGRISSFGLMEMSRQRLRTGVLEATTRSCPHCDGTGLVRTASSAGLSALRLIEDEAARGKGTQIRLAASTEAAIYLLNEKRADLVEIEQRYGVSVEVVPEGEDEGAKMSVSSAGPRPTHAPKFEPIVDEDDDDLPEEEDDFAEDEADAETDRREARQPRRERGDGDGEDEDGGGRKKKRRRRRGGRGRSREREDGEAGEAGDAGDEAGEPDSDGEERGDSAPAEGDDGEARPKKRRRRGGRGRKRREGGEGEAQDGEAEDDDGEAVTGEDAPAEAEAEAEAAAGSPEEAEAAAPAEAPAETPAEAPVEAEAPAAKPKRVRAPRKKKVADPVAEEVPAELAPELAAEAADAAATQAEAPAEKPKRKRAPRKAKVADAAPAATAEVSEPAPAEEAAAEAPADEAAPGDEGKPRRGWWQRTFGE